jgi:tetratricopeptide (TPR) repeat protein
MAFLMKKILSYILILLFQAVTPLHGMMQRPDDALRETHEDILDAILHLRFDRADSLIALTLSEDLGDSRIFYLQNYLEFLNALITGEKPVFELYLKNADERVEAIRKGDKANPYAFTDLSSIYLQSAILSAYHAEQYKAIRNFYRAYRNLRHAGREEGVRERDYLNLGLIKLGLASVPEEYSWILSIFGLKGTQEEGLGYLKEYHAFTNGTGRMEACLILRLVSNMVDPARKTAGMPGDCHHDSLTLFRYAQALKDLGAGNSPSVIEILGNYHQDGEERELPFLDLLLGEALLNSLDTTAGMILERFTGRYRGGPYRSYAWHKLSWHYAMNGEWEKYERARQEVQNSGDAFLDADRQAVWEAADSLPLNVRLVRARVLFDGGYYARALEELQPARMVPLFSRRDSVELVYRQARIWDRLGESEKARQFYEKVLLYGTGEDWVFAPAAALHLGRIQAESGNHEKALEYYRECLKINKSAYKKSIDYKAQQAIQKIQELEKLR